MRVPDYQEVTHLFEDGLTLEAREKILALREAVIALQEENLALKQRLQAAEAGQSQSRKVYFKKGAYWREGLSGEGPSTEGPFCQVCYDKEEKLVHLTWHPAPPGGWYCGACRNEF